MRRRAVLALLLSCLVAGAAQAQPTVLVLDASGSMWGRVDGRTRIGIVRDALGALISAWPADRPVGLVAYGHRRAGECADVELLVSPGPDPAAVEAALDGIRPRGRTAAAEAVRLAAETLGPGGGSVILLSDGIDTCHPDPCAVAQQIARSGTRLAIHTIGFAISDPATAAQLRCMAEATGGRAAVARDAAELAEALERAAAATAPGGRASAPRPEPVPVPRLIVTLRLCAGCEPMNGDASIALHRDGAPVATDGDPFGRFFDLPAGEYAVTVTTAAFTRGPVAATVPANGVGRVDVLLDAGWLVGDVRGEPSGEDVTDRAALTWEALGETPDGDRRSAEAAGGPSFLVPTGTHRLTARIGNATGSAEAAVTAGEVVILRVPIRFGTIALERDGFGAAPGRVTITDLADDSLAYEDVPRERVVAIPLAPGAYRVEVVQGDRAAADQVVVEAGETVPLTLRPAE